MRTVTMAAIGVCLGLGLGAVPAFAGEHMVKKDHPGYPYYQQYCASCHGVFADGKGPVAPVLTSPPPDLTLLARKYGDPLPRARIRAFIDGETMPRSHGATDMPIWGTELRRQASPTTPSRNRMMLGAIVDYLSAIQQPVAKK